MIKSRVNYNGETVTNIDRRMFKDWMVKSPGVKHRLNRAGTCSLNRTEYRSYLKDKKGICYVDITKKCFVLIPLHILELHPPEPKNFMGVKDSLYVFNIKQILLAHPELELTPIEGEYKHAFQTGLSGQVRKQFGLK